MANINKIRVSGTTYDIQDSNAPKTVELTQAQYDALVTVDPNTFYIITDATAGDLSNYYTKSETSGATEISTALATKQDTLVSRTNIKTINNESILGSGNITIEGGGSSYTAGDGIDITNDVISVTGKVDTTAFTAHTADTVIHVTAQDKTNWNNKSDFSGDYNDLVNKPTIPTVPTSNTAFTNDAGYITIDAISGKVDTSTYNTYTAATDAALASKANTATTYTKTEVDTALASKQTTLTAGTNITIVDNVISAEGGSDINVAQTTGTSTADVMSQNAVTTALNNKQNSGNYWNLDTDPYRLTEATSIINENPSVQTSAIMIHGYDFDGSNSNDLYEFKYINGKPIFRYKYGGEIEVESYGNLSLVETSAITTSVTSSSTDAQVPSAKAVNDKLGGLSIVKLTQAEYDALSPNYDSNTLYVIVN